jgi:uncharacterized protein (DUF433 family)
MDISVLHIIIDEESIPRIVNRRIKVKMIAQKHVFTGESPQKIAEHYGIDLSDVYAALAYYYDNQAAMDADFERSEALLKQVGVSGEELNAKIRQRMQEKASE